MLDAVLRRVNDGGKIPSHLTLIEELCVAFKLSPNGYQMHLRN